MPFFNVLNGGKHSGNTMAFQEFMIAPVGAKSLTHAVQLGSVVYQALKAVIAEKHGASGKAVPTINNYPYWLLLMRFSYWC